MVTIYSITATYVSFNHDGTKFMIKLIMKYNKPKKNALKFDIIKTTTVNLVCPFLSKACSSHTHE